MCLRPLMIVSLFSCGLLACTTPSSTPTKVNEEEASARQEEQAPQPDAETPPREDVVLPERVQGALEELLADAEILRTTQSAPPLSQSSSEDEVSERLQEMVDLDQHLRSGFQRLFSFDMSEAQQQALLYDLAHEMLAQDKLHTEELKAFVQCCGWPTIKRYGEQTAGHAWLIAQHADRDVDFQQDVLALMKVHLDTQDVSPQNYAYLWDRVAMNKDAPQRYGTQGRCVGQGQWEPFEVEEPAQLDSRRAAIGLGPMREYEALFVLMCP